jgi:SAM-dependent methyltransferase
MSNTADESMMAAATADEIRESYDAVPYLAGSFPRTHPDYLRSLALLAGIDAPVVTSCRVLEVGCAFGRNLMPMAQSLPGSQFLGIDLSPRQIEAGQRVVQELGFRNIELRCQDLMTFDEGEGHFDYIIAHGLYSWVPPVVRRKLLEICGRQLSPCGVAYISYNTLPGWHLLRLVRDMMLFHIAGKPDADVKQRMALAHQMIEFTAQPSPGFKVYKTLMNEVRQHQQSRPDWYLLHEFAAPVNEPFYLLDFTRDLTDHGLKYLAGAEPPDVSPQQLPPALNAHLDRLTSDELQRQQYLDFLQGRAFRGSVLCRADAPVTLPRGPAAVTKLFIAGAPTEETGQDAATKTGVVHFGAPGAEAKLTVSDPGMIAAMGRINTAWPHAVPFAELLDLAWMISPVGENRDEVASAMAEALLLAERGRVVRLWTRPTDFIAPNTQRPRVTELARWQVTHGEPLVDLRHHQQTPTDAMKVLMPLMDGTRDRETLLRELRRLVEQGAVNIQGPHGRLFASDDLRPFLSQFLEDMWKRGFLAAAAAAAAASYGG